VGHEPVVSGVAHGRVQEAVDHQGPGVLVHLVLDGLAPDGDLDDDIDLVRGIGAQRNSFDSQENSFVRARM
jgi:hypothetical protein